MRQAQIYSKYINVSIFFSLFFIHFIHTLRENFYVIFVSTLNKSFSLFLTRLLSVSSHASSKIHVTHATTKTTHAAHAHAAGILTIISKGLAVEIVVVQS